MIKKNKLRQSTIIFNSIAVIALVGSFIIYNLFIQTKQNIEDMAINSQIHYIDNITNNISDILLQKTNSNIYEALSSSDSLRDNLEKDLQLFITDRYKYIYVLDKGKNNKHGFRFLLDGSPKEEKSEFEEPYRPLDIKIWDTVYDTKTERYFKHKKMKNLWMTYLKPILVDDEVVAIIVIDFSLEASETIVSSLEALTQSFEVVILFSIVIFFVIIRFSYLDTKRENKKEELYRELKEKTKSISEFNKTLTQKVKEELEKNRIKDKQLLQQSRLAQMGKMLSMIAHQWRQPLAAISSTSAGIELKAKLGKLEQAQAANLAAKISQYSQHLSSTIDDFREFFKPNKEKKESSLDIIVKEVLNIVEAAIENKNIKIIQELNAPTIFNTYPNEIKQVVLNLMKNAEDVLLEKEVKDAYIKIKTSSEKDYLLLQVSDNGGGIAEVNIDKIFDPYFSTKIEKDGTGLGLYMSKSIIQEHCAGKISVTNSKEGAVFSIKLRTL